MPKINYLSMSEINAYMEHKYAVSLSLNIATTFEFFDSKWVLTYEMSSLKACVYSFYQMIAL